MSSHPNDWMQLNYTDGNRSTGIPPATAPAASGGTSAPRNNDQPLDHGRGARPIRRRSRASRRTPTTLLNTDTTNFRAMVQQFTGGPAAAATVPHLSEASGMFDFRQQIVPNEGGGARFQYPMVPNQMHMQQLQRRHVFMVGEEHAPPESSAPNGSLSRGYYNYML